MALLPQDIVVALKLVAKGDASRRWTYAELSEELSSSPSQVFRSVRRAETAHLLSAPQVPTMRPLDGAPVGESGVFLFPIKNNLREFLIHGVKYAFPVERGGPTRGVPTAEAAAPLIAHFGSGFAMPPVWPYPAGSTRGLAFSPLSKNAPEAALRDPKLYELLTLVDAIREGRAREREFAIRALSARLE